AVDSGADDALVHRVDMYRDRTGVSERAEVLRGKEGEAAEVAERAGADAAELRADRLRRVLDDRDVVAAGDGVDLVHRRALAVEVDRHDRSRLRRDARLDLRRGEVVVVEDDVDEGRHRAE